MAFFTDADVFQAALSACLSLRDWDFLVESFLILDEMMPMAFARLAELAAQECAVSSVLSN